MDVYTLARWKVRAGEEERFLEAWAELGRVFRALPHPPSAEGGVLIQSLDDPTVFYSFGPWDDPAHIAEMRANPEAQQAIAAVIALCDEATPGGYRVVARA